MRISDWSSDVCSSDLMVPVAAAAERQRVVFWHLDRRFVRRLEDLRDSIAGMELWALRRLCPAFTGAGLARDGADGRSTDRKSKRRTTVLKANHLCRLLLEHKDSNKHTTYNLYI